MLLQGKKGNLRLRRRDTVSYKENLRVRGTSFKGYRSYKGNLRGKGYAPTREEGLLPLKEEGILPLKDNSYLLVIF